MASRGSHSSARSMSSGGPSKLYKRNHGCASPVSPQMTTGDFRKILNEGLNPLSTELDGIKKSIDSLKCDFGKEFDSIGGSIDTIKQEFSEVTAALELKVSDLISENSRLKDEQCQSASKIARLTDRVVSLESHMRRDNLKFLNIKFQTGQRENCEEKILALCHDMNIPLESKDIVRAHRVGPKFKESQAIIVKFQHFKDKLRILRAKNSFRAIGILIVEDFPVEVMERRKVFSPILKAAYNSDGRYRARLVVDKLLLNGRMYTTDDIGSLPTELQPAATSTITRDDITAFFTYKSPLSNHHPCKMTIEDKQFSYVEQFFMFKKATFFNDQPTSLKILEISNPKEAKTLGKQMKGFDEDSWSSVCDGFMKSGLEAKFHQNQELMKFLKDTGNTKLVEANPHDQYWGAGLAIHDNKIWEQKNWAGKNTLGKLLEDIRRET